MKDRVPNLAILLTTFCSLMEDVFEEIGTVHVTQTLDSSPLTAHSSRHPTWSEAGQERFNRGLVDCLFT